MPSKAGSPFMGERRATPLLPRFPNLISNSRTKSPYSFSLTSQLPRLLLEYRTPSLTVQTASLAAGLDKSFHWRTVQPLGTPSSANRRTKPSSSARLALTTTANRARQSRNIGHPPSPWGGAGGEAGASHPRASSRYRLTPDSDSSASISACVPLRPYPCARTAS